MATGYEAAWPDWLSKVLDDADNTERTFFVGHFPGLRDSPVQQAIVHSLDEARTKGATHEELVRRFNYEVGVLREARKDW